MPVVLLGPASDQPSILFLGLNRFLTSHQLFLCLFVCFSISLSLSISTVAKYLDFAQPRVTSAILQKPPNYFSYLYVTMLTTSKPGCWQIVNPRLLH